MGGPRHAPPDTTKTTRSRLAAPRFGYQHDRCRTGFDSIHGMVNKRGLNAIVLVLVNPPQDRQMLFQNGVDEAALENTKRTMYLAAHHQYPICIIIMMNVPPKAKAPF